MPAIVCIAAIESGYGPARLFGIHIDFANLTIRSQGIHDFQRSRSDLGNHKFARRVYRPLLGLALCPRQWVGNPAKRQHCNAKTDAQSKQNSSDTMIHAIPKTLCVCTLSLQ